MPEFSPEDKGGRQWPGREAQLRKKGKLDGVRASLPPKIIFLRGRLGKQGCFSASPEPPISVQLPAQCSSWLLPALPRIPAHH